jgi:hypothetical protein
MIYSSGLPSMPGKGGLGSLSAYLGPWKRVFDSEEWAINVASRKAGIPYEKDPDAREKMLAEVMENDPKRFGIFAKTYESMRPSSSTNATGDIKSYGEGEPKSSKNRWVAIGLGAGAAFAALAGVVIADQYNEPVVDVQPPIIDEDVNQNGVPDSWEIERGYSTDVKNLFRATFVQNPDKNLGLVEEAESILAHAYKEKSPIQIVVHSFYAGDIPSDIKYGTQEYADFVNSHNPLATSEDTPYKYHFRAYYLDGGDERGAGLAGQLSSTIFIKSPFDGRVYSNQALANISSHELGHNLGLDHSSRPDSIMYDPVTHSGIAKFYEDEWEILKDKPLYPG